MFSGKFIKRNLSVLVSDMALSYAQYKDIHDVDEGLAWE